MIKLFRNWRIIRTQGKKPLDVKIIDGYAYWGQYEDSGWMRYKKARGDFYQASPRLYRLFKKLRLL